VNTRIVSPFVYGLVLLLLVSPTINNNDVIAQRSKEKDGQNLVNIPIVLPHETQYAQSEGSIEPLDTCNAIAPTSITASGYVGNNNPNKVIDGDSSTKWSSLAANSWIKLDLGSKKAICSLAILWDYPRYITYTFAISLSDDGVNFGPPVFSSKSNRNSEGFETYVLPSGTEGKSMKISVKSDNRVGYSGIKELRVFGANAPQPPPDTTSPAQVAGLSVTTVSSTNLNLGWTGNTETDLNHYNVYRGTTPGFDVIPGTTPPVARPATNSYSDTGLTGSTTYYYKVAAVDNAGNIGALSVERSGTTSPPPQPPPQPNLYDDFESSSLYSLTDGQVSPNGKWKSLFTGFGPTKIAQEGSGNKYIYLEPMTSTSPQETHGSAVATTTSYKNFELSLDVKTIKQLRQNSPPNNWETAFLLWNTIDQFHTYGFTLKIHGFQLEKKDNNNQDDSAEIFLVTQNSPSVKLDTWQKWQITVTGTETGTPRIQIWIDGVKIVDYLDNQPGIPRNSEIMKQGGPIVLYTEDAAVGFDNVAIRPL
jgi:hypothetical protein